MRIALLSLLTIGSLALAGPASGQMASTICKDGSPSAVSGRGACSAHGGIDKARTKAANKAVKAEAKEVVKEAKAAGTMVTCGDGSSSKPGRGACSRHGGVKIGPTASPAPAMPAMPATRATPATPAMAPAPRVLTATPICKDGSTSTVSGRGACSGHGGIDQSRTMAADNAVKAEVKEVNRNAKSAGTMVTCGDGSMGNPGRGACSGHGGVKIGPTAPATPAMPAMPASPARPAAPMSASSHRGEDNDPSGAIAQCKDGMYSHSANRRGACSRHQGVAKWMQM